MSRNLSTLILAGAAVVVGVFFFRVIWPFLFPLMFAAVLALLVRPLYDWMVRRFRGHNRVAAAVTTVGVLVLAILPLGAGLIFAVQELVAWGSEVAQDAAEEAEERPVASDVRPQLEQLRARLSDEQYEQVEQAARTAVHNMIAGIYERTRSFIADLIRFAIGLALMGLALYYFLADGPAMLAQLKRLSPLEERDEDRLVEQFDRVTRGIILGTILSAVVQAVLAGAGFAAAGVERVWLLSLATFLAAMVPFLGAAFVWAPVAIVLLWQGEYVAGSLLAIYGTFVISTVDNLIRAWTVHGSAALHPLIVLVTMLGGLYVVGVWGIFVGPIVAAFFYSLLRTFNEKVEAIERDRTYPPTLTT